MLGTYGASSLLAVDIQPPRSKRDEAHVGRTLMNEEFEAGGQIKGMDELLYRQRHSAAHIMAEAVLATFPEAKYAIGPPIENGFYYDFELPRPLTPEDLEAIDKLMRVSIGADKPFQRIQVS